MLVFLWGALKGGSKSWILSMGALVATGILAVAVWNNPPAVYQAKDVMTNIEDTYQAKVLEINKRTPSPKDQVTEASNVTIKDKNGKVMVGCHIRTVADQQRLLCDNTEPVVPPR